MPDYSLQKTATGQPMLIVTRQKACCAECADAERHPLAESDEMEGAELMKVFAAIGDQQMLEHVKAQVRRLSQATPAIPARSYG